jgi:ubiquitin C-terminal hydrolase
MIIENNDNTTITTVKNTRYCFILFTALLVAIFVKSFKSGFRTLLFKDDLLLDDFAMILYIKNIIIIYNKEMQGLQNLGSTCAVNSLIQIICREPKLRNTIINNDFAEDTLVAHLKEILHLMHNENKSLVPGKFVTKLFKSLDGIFRLGEQLDIGELWIFLFDKIAEEINGMSNTSYELPQIVMENTDHIDMGIQYLDDFEYKKALIGCPQLRNKYEYTLRKFNKNRSSKWLESCQGFYLNIIKCEKCQNVLYNFEPFTSISLDILEYHCPTITKMLREFLKEEKRQGDWKCEKCNECTEYKKTIKIWKIPDVLVFIIKRFSNGRCKNSDVIDINKTICFKRGAVLSDIDNDVIFTLSSLGIHYGSLHGGHYCAICNTDDDPNTRGQFEKIVFYDDINISPIQRDKFIQVIEKNSDGYMIVYSRQGI